MKTLFSTPKFNFYYTLVEGVSDEIKNEIDQFLINFGFKKLTSPQSYFYSEEYGDMTQLIQNEFKERYASYIKDAWIDKVQSSSIVTSLVKSNK